MGIRARSKFSLSRTLPMINEVHTQYLLLTGEIEPELPEQIFFLRCQYFAWRIPDDLLKIILIILLSACMEDLRPDRR